MDGIDFDVTIEEKMNQENRDAILQLEGTYYERQNIYEIENDSAWNIDEEIKIEDDILLEQYVENIRNDINIEEMYLDATRKSINEQMNRVLMEMYLMRQEFEQIQNVFVDTAFELFREQQRFQDELLECDYKESLLEREHATNPYLHH